MSENRRGDFFDPHCILTTRHSQHIF